MSKHYAIGVDLGGTSLRAALVDRKGKLGSSRKVSSEGDVMSSLSAVIKELWTDGVVGVGIGVAGLVDREGHGVISSPNLHALDGRSFNDLGLKVPLMVENDANAAALGERWLGAGRDIDNFVLITLGTGIGGAVFYHGELLDVAAEAGHMCVEAGGISCPCGGHGCLELYASATAIKNAATTALEQGTASILRDCCRGNIYRITTEDVYRAARDGDTLARGILKDAGRYLGVGIANMVNLFSPQAVILAGGLTGAWDIFVQEAIRESGKRTLKGLAERARLIRSPLPEDEIGVLGAAAMVLDDKGHHV